MLIKKESFIFSYWKSFSLNILFLVSSVLICDLAKSQNVATSQDSLNTVPVENGKEKRETIVNDGPEYVFVDFNAEFQGGDINTFREWVQKNLVSPLDTFTVVSLSIVTVKFVVDTIGRVRDVKILKSPNTLLNDEAKRIVSSSPEWSPARQAGKKVKQMFVIPVDFHANSENVSLVDKSIDSSGYEKNEAKFNGEGVEKFHEWVQSNLVYPPDALKRNIMGRVLIQYTITTSGKIADVTILNGVHPLLAAEAVRVVQSSPDWEPAKNAGETVEQRGVIPVIFKY